MAFAISLKVTNSTAEPIQGLWDQVAHFETAPSMAALDYPPHITLAVYYDIDPTHLKTALASAFAGASAFNFTFARLDYFDTKPLVLWAAPLALPALIEAHRAVHALIDPGRCHPHYRPDAWIPHCTLGTKIRMDQRAEAITLAAQPIQPFRVTFDVADCVSFPPVVVLSEYRLAHARKAPPLFP
jgi:2'-5' RNA ligase